MFIRYWRVIYFFDRIKENSRTTTITDEHKEKRQKYMKTFSKRDNTMEILFSDEKLFDIDGIYNCQNDRIWWAVSWVEANEGGGIKQKRKFLEKVMVWLAVCSKGVSLIVIFDEATIDWSYPIHWRSDSSGSQIRKGHPENLLVISPNAWCPSSNAIMV